MSQIGIQIVKRHEGFREFAYPDPASPLAAACRKAGINLRWGFEPAARLFSRVPEDLRELSPKPWTVGYGETRDIEPDTRWSESEASNYLSLRYIEFESAVMRACTVRPNAHQLAAMTCLAYNVGVSGFQRSTVRRAHNRGDHQAASRAFTLWNKAGGRVYPGLTRRRAEEAALYLKPVPDDVSDGAADEAMPQTVDAESSMAASPINRSAAIAGGTAAVATVAETARTVGDIKYSVADLGDWLVPIMLLVIVALCGYLIWQRVQQRKGGWA